MGDLRSLRFFPLWFPASASTSLLLPSAPTMTGPVGAGWVQALLLSSGLKSLHKNCASMAHHMAGGHRLPRPWPCFSAPPFPSLGRMNTFAVRKGKAALLVRPWCSPVEHKQFHRTPTSGKATLTVMGRDKNRNTLESCLNTDKNTNIVQSTKMTKHLMAAS